MSNKYHEMLGFYEPSIFHLHVKGTGEIKNIDKWMDNQKSTFIHEYVHFLQDILSVQGLFNMYINGEYLRFVTKVYQSNHTHELKIPVNPRLAGFNVDQNWIVKYNTFGEIGYNIAKVIKYDIVHAVDLRDYQTNDVISVNNVQVKCINHSGSISTIVFGTIQIMEGMAKLIQNCIYPENVSNSPYNPYYIARDVANLIIPGLSAMPYSMIALYDYALQSSNPGYAFVNYLEQKRDEGYTFSELNISSYLR